MENRFMRALVPKLKQKLDLGPIAYRLARGAGWSFVGAVASQVFGLLSSIVIARLIGREGYGEVGMVQSTAGMLGMLAGLGVGSAAVKFVAEYRLKSPDRAAATLRVVILTAFCGGVAIAALCFAFAPLLAEHALSRASLAPLLREGAVLLLVSTLAGVQLAALSGFEAFGQIAMINIVQGLANPIVAIPCVWFLGVPGAIASATIVAALGMLLSSLALSKECGRHRISLDWRVGGGGEWPILWRFAFPSLLSALMVTPVIWITNAILVSQPNGYGELGLFNAANQWRTIILYIPAIMGPAMLPVLSETYGREDRSDFKQAVYLNLRVAWLLALPLTVLVLGCAVPLAALFGKQFSGAGEMISLLAVACFLNVVNGTVGAALAGSGRMWTGLFMNLGWAIVLVVASMLLIPNLAGRGLAVAYVLAYLFHTVWVMSYVELNLAPSSITRQWRLIIFTVIVIAASFQMSVRQSGMFVYQLLLLLIASTPLVLAAKSRFWRTPA